MKALKTSLLVGISAFFRVLFAQELVGSVNFKACLAFSLTVLAVYVLDRSFDFKSNGEFIFAVLFTLMASIIYPYTLIVPYLALFVGFMYSKGINGFRLKMGYGVKNIVTSLTWGVVIAFFSKINIAIILFFTLKSFIITVLNDIKDLEDDIKSGIRTLPAILKDKTLHFLLLVNVIVHIVALYLLPYHCYLTSLLISIYTIKKIKPKISQIEFLIQSILITFDLDR